MVLLFIYVCLLFLIVIFLILQKFYLSSLKKFYFLLYLFPVKEVLVISLFVAKLSPIGTVIVDTAVFLMISNIFSIYFGLRGVVLRIG